jgi:hypothetical protein
MRNILEVEILKGNSKDLLTISYGELDIFLEEEFGEKGKFEYLLHSIDNIRCYNADSLEDDYDETFDGRVFKVAPKVTVEMSEEYNYISVSVYVEAREKKTQKGIFFDYVTFKKVL